MTRVTVQLKLYWTPGRDEPIAVLSRMAYVTSCDQTWIPPRVSGE